MSLIISLHYYIQNTAVLHLLDVWIFLTAYAMQNEQLFAATLHCFKWTCFPVVTVGPSSGWVVYCYKTQRGAGKLSLCLGMLEGSHRGTTWGLSVTGNQQRSPDRTMLLFIRQYNAAPVRYSSCELHLLLTKEIQQYLIAAEMRMTH